MKATRALAAAFVVLLCCFLSSCSHAPQPTPLFDGVISYQSFAQVKSLPKWKDRDWKVIEDSGLPRNDTRPPFNILNVKTDNYSHLGFKGEVQLDFFNGRLTAIWFIPVNFSSYKKALIKTQNIKFDANNSASFGNTDILFARNYLGKDYVRWSDETLTQESSDWIKRYA